MPHQREGVARLLALPYALLADPPGYGKTLQAIVWAKYQGMPTVVVTMKSLIPQWKDEILLADPGTITEILPGGVVKVVGYGDRQWVLTTYERVQYVRMEGEFAIICDEVTQVKNPKARRSKLTYDLARKASRVLLLSGTPMVNRPLDLWPIFYLCRQREKYEYWSWVLRYCDATKTPWGWDLSGASNLDELGEELSAFSVSRPKGSVKIPDILRRTITLDIPIEVPTGLFTVPLRSAAGLDLIQRLRLSCAKGKVEFVVDWIKEKLQVSQAKIVIGSNFIEPLQKIVKGVGGDLLIGECSSEERRQIIERFKTSGSVLAMTIQTGGMGLNLQETTHAILLDLPWSPKDVEQWEHRFARLGADHPVEVITVLSGEPIEKMMWQALNNKQEIIEGVQAYVARVPEVLAQPG